MRKQIKSSLIFLLLSLLFLTSCIIADSNTDSLFEAHVDQFIHALRISSSSQSSSPFAIFDQSHKKMKKSNDDEDAGGGPCAACVIVLRLIEQLTIKEEGHLTPKQLMHKLCAEVFSKEKHPYLNKTCTLSLDLFGTLIIKYLEYGLPVFILFFLCNLFFV